MSAGWDRAQAAAPTHPSPYRCSPPAHRTPPAACPQRKDSSKDIEGAVQQVFQRFSGSLQKILEDIDRRVAVVEAAEQSSSACAASATAHLAQLRCCTSRLLVCTGSCAGGWRAWRTAPSRSARCAACAGAWDDRSPNCRKLLPALTRPLAECCPAAYSCNPAPAPQSPHPAPAPSTHPPRSRW